MASVAPELPLLARDQAFERLYRRHVKDVYHYALALLRNPADAEDVTQTTFLNAFRALQSGQRIEKPQNWLIKIAHNVARTRYARASRRVKEVPLEEHVEQLAVPEEERPNVEGVLRALGRLPFNQRAALVMRELEGRSYAEIADTLAVSVAAVETLIFRARRSLRIRTSALRAITAVPVPGSLAQLLEGGAVLGGGGALGATTLIAKTAVALVVGAVATGLGGDRAGRATPAPEVRAAQPAAAATSIRTLQTTRTAIVTKRGASRAVLVTRKPTVKRHSVSGTTLTAQPHVRPHVPQKTVVLSASVPGTTSTTSSPTSTAAAVTQPVADVVQTVEQTVSQTVSETVSKTVSSAVSALPVQLPPAPALPVEVPKVPGLP